MSVWTTVCEWFAPLGEMLWLNALVIVPSGDSRGDHIIDSPTSTGHQAWRLAGRLGLVPPTAGATGVSRTDRRPHHTHTSICPALGGRGAGRFPALVRWVALSIRHGSNRRRQRAGWRIRNSWTAGCSVGHQ